MKLHRVVGEVLIVLTAISLHSSRAVSGTAAPSSSGLPTSAKALPGGVIRGQVRLEGPPLKPVAIHMSSDPACAKLHPAAVSSDDFIMGAEGKLANVVVFIADDVGGEAFNPPADPYVMEQKGCMYKPHVVALQVNQKLRIVNSDTTMHNIHPAPVNNREWNKAQPGGTTIEDSFAREEIAIPVKCNVHPWMKSYIAVFKHPFFFVTQKDGAFELPNLAPGEYTLQAWHEKLGLLKQKISVAPGAVTTTELVFKSPVH